MCGLESPQPVEWPCKVWTLRGKADCYQAADHLFTPTPQTISFHRKESRAKARTVLRRDIGRNREIQGLLNCAAEAEHLNFFVGNSKLWKERFVRLRPIIFLVLSIAITAPSAKFAMESPGGTVAASEPNRGFASETEIPKVHTVMRNVGFHLTDQIVVHINTLEGTFAPTHQNQIPVFDDKSSFQIDVATANITLTTTALSNDLNDYVFSRPGAPLKKLTVSIKDDELIVKGLLANKGGIPFESDGTVSVTSDGLIRVHTNKVKAAGLPVKGLMDLLGIETSKLLNTKKVVGVTFDKDDLLLNPEEILPPPQIRGTLSSIQLRNRAVALKFGGGQNAAEPAEFANRCGGRNFMSFRGGSVRFGKLIMNDTDLELIDSEPGDPLFDFSLDHFKDQLAAGYAKPTSAGGLCVHMPNFDKLKQNRGSTAK